MGPANKRERNRTGEDFFPPRAPPALIRLYLILHQLAPLISATLMFLIKVVPLISLFVSGVWAQLDMAQCKAGYEWVCVEPDMSQGAVTSML